MPTAYTATKIVHVPRVFGSDDWAWHKGQRYGAILVDLERHRVVDLLPDSAPDTHAARLHGHPGAEFISRDRACGYADAAMRGAPDAIRIADHFYLLRNLTDAAQHALERHHVDMRAIGLGTRTPVPVLAKRGGTVSSAPSRLASDVPVKPPLAEQQKLVWCARR